MTSDNYSHVSEDFVDTNNKDDSNSVYRSWEQYGLEDQLLYNEDGSVFNLSSLDWGAVNIYEYETSNSSEIEYEVITAGRGVALSIFALIFLVGLIGNALVIYTVARYVTMRRVTYLYLLNLSAADILYLLACLPALSVSYALVDWRFGRIFCKLENYIMSVSMAVSVLTIMATGLDRYIAVIHPLKSRTFRTTWKTVSVICLTWLLSLAIMSPRIPIFDEITTWHLIGMTTLCSRVQTDSILLIDTSLNFVFMYLLPLLALSACHARIGRKLWKSRRPGQMGMLLVRDRRRIAKMVFAITIIFAIGWLPIHVYHLVEDFDKGNILFGEVIDRGTIVLFFSFGANALNPIVYCLFSGSFRKHFKQVLRCRRPRFVMSINTDDFGYLRAPLAQAAIQEYRLPPLVLLPRPASLLQDPVSTDDSKSGCFDKTTCSSRLDFLPLQPLLQAESELNSSYSDRYSNPSPVSVKKVAHIEVNNFALASGSASRQEQDKTTSSSEVRLENISCKTQPYKRRKSASFSASSFSSRPSSDSTVSHRTKSFDYLCRERKRLGTVVLQETSKLKKRFTDRQEEYDKHMINKGCTHKQEHHQLILERHHLDGQSQVSHTHLLPISDTTKPGADRTNHTSSQSFECGSRMNTPSHIMHIEVNSPRIKCANQQAAQKTSLGLPVSKILKSDTVCHGNSTTPPFMNEVSKIKKPKSLSRSDLDHSTPHPSHRDKFRTQPSSLNTLSYPVCKKKKKTARDNNPHSNLPPAE